MSYVAAQLGLELFTPYTATYQKWGSAYYGGTSAPIILTNYLYLEVAGAFTIIIVRVNHHENVIKKSLKTTSLCPSASTDACVVLMGAFEKASSDLDNVQEIFNETNSADILERLDAGLRSLDHCLWDIHSLFASIILIQSSDKSKLPPWRYYSRSFLIPLLRWETQYLAVLQRRIRTPALDSYFSITANLGTHNFFMVVLPILFWCGHTAIGRGWVL